MVLKGRLAVGYRLTAFAAISAEGLRVATPASSGWRVEMTLGGPGLRCLAADPLAPGTLYVGRDGDGMLKSVDGGQTWNPAGLRETNLRTVAVSPTVAGRVYAGTRPPALFVSDDSGRNWRELPALAAARRWFWLTPAEPVTPYVQAIALAPDDPDLLLVGIETGAVLRSEDGGRTFSGHRRGAMRDCHSLAFHPTAGAWAYEGGYGGGRVSENGGRTWRKPAGTRYLRYGWAACADVSDPSTWYFSAAPGAFRAHGGKDARAHLYRCRAGSVDTLAGGLPQPLRGMPYTLLSEPERPGCLHLGLSDGHVWQTVDAGENWALLDVDLGRVDRGMVSFPVPAQATPR